MKVYPAKISYGLIAFIVLTFYIPLGYAFFTEGITTELIGVTIFLTLLLVFVLHLFLSTKYIIDDKMLKIKFGIFSLSPIDIDTIKEVSNTKSLLSAPAPSFDRIIIKYEKYNDVIISPKDKENFIIELKKINPNIKII